MSDYILLKRTTIVLEDSPTWVIEEEGLKKSEAVATAEENSSEYRILKDESK
jgi:hypothetical protein